jgi:uncharacterized damage-inducible protein DinB
MTNPSEKSDSLKITQNDDGSYEMSWDKKDPTWSFLNHLTSKEIQVIVKRSNPRQTQIIMTLDYQKIWNVMNDLEMVSSKISSAREILDCAVDRLQEHQYDKAETLLYAADEFLQYYLEEFDRKFKDAWTETVTKVHQQEYSFSSTQDTSTEYKGAWNGFWEEEPKQDKVVKWVLPIERKIEDGMDDYFIHISR